jgi:hypothetical protein
MGKQRGHGFDTMMYLRDKKREFIHREQPTIGEWGKVELPIGCCTAILDASDYVAGRADAPACFYFFPQDRGDPQWNDALAINIAKNVMRRMEKNLAPLGFKFHREKGTVGCIVEIPEVSPGDNYPNMSEAEISEVRKLPGNEQWELYEKISATIREKYKDDTPRNQQARLLFNSFVASTLDLKDAINKEYFKQATAQTGRY